MGAVICYSVNEHPGGRQGKTHTPERSSAMGKSTPPAVLRERRTRLRRLSNAALFALVRGAATATGTGLVGLASWWLAHHA